MLRASEIALLRSAQRRGDYSEEGMRGKMFQMPSASTVGTLLPSSRSEQPCPIPLPHRDRERRHKRQCLIWINADGRSDGRTRTPTSSSKSSSFSSPSLFAHARAASVSSSSSRPPSPNTTRQMDLEQNNSAPLALYLTYPDSLNVDICKVVLH